MGRVTARGFFVETLRSLGLTLERAGTVSVYVAAGAMRLAMLERHIRDDWGLFGAQQPEQDISSGLFPWEREFYAPFLQTGDTILVVGCGGGRDLLSLREMGYRADGIDPSPECVAQARARLAARGVDAGLFVGRIETFPLPRRFDIFVFSWFCYSYIPQRRTRIEVLRRVKDHLRPDGRILITYLRRDPAPRRLPVQLARLASRLSGSDWRPEYGDVVSARHDAPVVHYEHRFAADEIEAEAEAAGLSMKFHEHAGNGNLVLTA